MLDTAVISCGGLGTSLQPITRWLPKELLPVGFRPVLHWTLDEIADAGLVRAILITSPLKPALEAVAAPNGQLAGARSEAAGYEVGLPDGYGSTVADSPACA